LLTLRATGVITVQQRRQRMQAGDLVRLAAAPD
jgi:hypothetical protein